MDHLTAILFILPIHFAVMVSPGPNFILLSGMALSISRRAAVEAAFGVAVGSLIWMIAAALGVSALLQALPALGLGLKIAGGGYLIYLGIKLWCSGPMKTGTSSNPSIKTKDNAFMRGMFVNLTSPKSAAYFGSIFATVLSGDMPYWMLGALIVAFFILSIMWHGALAVLFSTEIVRTPYLRFSKIINRVAGAFLVVFGARMIGDAR